MVPDIQQEDIDSVVSVLQSGNLIQGRKVAELENNISDYVGSKHAIAVSNGTATMHLILLALGIGKGDEVIIPAFSYMATANVVEIVGATPIFVDIDIETFNINTELIEQAITSRTKAILPVHEFGLSCNMEEICVIAKKHNLIVIEDAACALGAKDNNKMVGTFGMAGSFSFHPRKAITCGEGGIITTNDDLLANKLRTLRNHGIEIQNDKQEFIEAGYNYRMTDFQAALVNNQLKRLPNVLNFKNELAKIYIQNLQNQQKFRPPLIPENKNHTWQSFHILTKDKSRDLLIEILKEKGIGTNYGAQCMPAQKYYLNKYNLDYKNLFPNAWAAYTNGLVLPLYERLNFSDIDFISNELKNV